ncbi:hypothetical protein RchiOBHm_Chr6g0305201 [Rosa chinensis]|uniref:Uncharacterized protein n=1 Tax=Rosa chinensis TaxID=74649 RepID=A0A2P6PZQ8_ROSCH|nr:hypothetical protein RchiOBHm_Chr6g0305201 [Rosa chinensis]
MIMLHFCGVTELGSFVKNLDALLTVFRYYRSKCSGLMFWERLGLGKRKSARNPGYQIGGLPCTCPCFPVLLIECLQSNLSNNILCFMSCNYCLLVVKLVSQLCFHSWVFIWVGIFLKHEWLLISLQFQLSQPYLESNQS